MYVQQVCVVWNLINTTHVGSKLLVAEWGGGYLMVRQWRIQDFPEEGAPTPGEGGGRQHTILPIFFQKLHENERIWTGGVPRTPPP